VAASLEDYLNRHKEMDERCSKNGKISYYTTENPERFKECAAMFLHEDVKVERVEL
jgi:glutamate racemase